MTVYEKVVQEEPAQRGESKILQDITFGEGLFFLAVITNGINTYPGRFDIPGAVPPSGRGGD